MAFFDTACDGYSWHDSTYTESGVYVYHYSNSNGVPSCDTLHLTVHHGSYMALDISSCDTFYGPDKGIGYATSIVDTISRLTYNGCDSILALQLTIYTSTQSTDEIHACDSFWWDQNGHIYRSSVTDTVRYASMGGCDSLHILSLVIDYSHYVLLDTTTCGSFYWGVTDSLYTQSEYDSVQMETVTGCDSIQKLQLTLHPIDSTHLFDTLCSGDSLWWHGQFCGQEVVYQFDSVSVFGCDSHVFLHLSIVEPPAVRAEYSYDCLRGCYLLTATTSAPYVEWYGEPADSAGLLPVPPDAVARPMTEVRYWVRADWREGLFCPAYDSLVLRPVGLPTARISVRPELLTEANLTLYAECRCLDAERLVWRVNDRWYAEDCANISFVASPEDDSVLLELVVENEWCADTVSLSVPVCHEVLYVPNVIVPEGVDPLQRQFRVRSEWVTEMEVTIYDRRGMPVFHSTDMEAAWDGSCRGAPCPQGAYVYCLRYRVPSVPYNWRSRMGTVTLIR